MQDLWQEGLSTLLVNHAVTCCEAERAEQRERLQANLLEARRFTKALDLRYVRM